MRPLGLIAIGLLCPLLVACGGGEPSAEPTATVTVSEDAATEDATGSATLKETCPAVETALPQDMLPSESSLTEFSGALFELYEAGDQETQNALRLFAEPVDTYIDVQSRQLTGQPLVEADQSFVAAIQSFAERCAAVGSSALQG